MEPIRYRPGEAIRWLHTEASRLKDDSIHTSIGGTVTESVKGVAGALFNLGRSAFAEIAHLKSLGSEFILFDDRIEIVKGKTIKSIAYSSIKTIEMRGDRITLNLETGTQSIRPLAYIVTGPLKVPIGWSRNGLEVHFHLLIEELSARCGVEVLAT